jgi:hypothetical protein
VASVIVVHDSWQSKGCKKVGVCWGFCPVAGSQEQNWRMPNLMQNCLSSRLQPPQINDEKKEEKTDSSDEERPTAIHVMSDVRN